jgi:hypothetical protein
MMLLPAIAIDLQLANIRTPRASSDRDRNDQLTGDPAFFEEDFLIFMSVDDYPYVSLGY